VSVVLDNPDLYVKAFGYTVALFVVSAVLSLVLGTLLVAMRVGPIAVLRRAASGYVTVVRNTPLVMIFLFLQVGAGKIFDWARFGWVDIHIGELDFTSFFTAAVVSLTLYTSCFVCEALRSGVNAVPLGQAEAARASVPPVASTLIALLKNTSVAAVFGVAEAAAQMKAFTNDNATERWGIFIAFALGYVILVELLSLVATMLERRWRIA
jgi:glutamate transport system permease protein